MLYIHRDLDTARALKNVQSRKNISEKLKKSNKTGDDKKNLTSECL